MHQHINMAHCSIHAGNSPTEIPHTLLSTTPSRLGVGSGAWCPSEPLSSQPPSFTKSGSTTNYTALHTCNTCESSTPTILPTITRVSNAAAAAAGTLASHEERNVLSKSGAQVSPRPSTPSFAGERNILPASGSQLCPRPSTPAYAGERHLLPASGTQVYPRPITPSPGSPRVQHSKLMESAVPEFASSDGLCTTNSTSQQHRLLTCDVGRESMQRSYQSGMPDTNASLQIAEMQCSVHANMQEHVGQECVGDVPTERITSQGTVTLLMTQCRKFSIPKI